MKTLHVYINMETWRQLPYLLSTGRNYMSVSTFTHETTLCLYSYGDMETLLVHIHVETWRHMETWKHSMSIYILEIWRHSMSISKWRHGDTLCPYSHGDMETHHVLIHMKTLSCLHPHLHMKTTLCLCSYGDMETLLCSVST